MNRCIQLAKNGLGSTYPNPMVGCVLVHNDKIIGEGWHKKSGLPHAEVVAIESVTEKSLLKQATLYVSLEPCSHYGKTPPCSDLIVASGIPTVVIGCKDPNSLVAGKGIEKLKSAGIEVIVGVLEEECEALNKRFFTFHRNQRPYIFLKWAETKDGFIAPQQKEHIAPVWITNSRSRQWVHKLRAQEQSILIGKTTLLTDMPSLTTRDWGGPNPLRLILCRKAIAFHQIPLGDSVPTVVFCSKPHADQGAVSYHILDFNKSIPEQICHYLYEMEIQSLIIEGGQTTLQSFIDANLWDEAYVFIGNMEFDEGVPSPRFHGNFIRQDFFEEDILKTFQNPDL